MIKVSAGVTYEFSADAIEGLPAFITISSADAATVLAAGTATVTWTADADRNVRFYTHRGANCSSNDFEFTARRVKCTQLVRDSYCEPTLDCTDGAVINRVKFAGMENISTCSNNGFADYSSKVATVQRGGTYDLEVEIGYGWFEQSVSVWIDYNKNFLFDANEFIFVGSTPQGILNKNITIPGTVANGEYRMRVRLATVGASGATAGKACDISDSYGETEDYTLKVDGTMSVGNTAAQELNIYPNPAHDFVNISGSAGIQQVLITDLSGKQVSSFAGKDKIDVSRLKAGVYMLTIRLQDGNNITRKLVKK
ncbi:hypothetical protein FIC_00910 [Flavobacteriaceae bacterium 3519-10]|nr:hypothetical protein FIC_00910 [Flavobacteriaceae bacterium 3519-10]